MAQEKSSPKVFSTKLNDELWRKSNSTDVKQLIDENRDNEYVSGNKCFVEKINNYLVKIGNSYGTSFSVLDG